MAQWDEEFGYKFDALGADLSLCFLTKFLEAFFDSFNIHPYENHFKEIDVFVISFSEQS